VFAGQDPRPVAHLPDSRKWVQRHNRTHPFTDEGANTNQRMLREEVEIDDEHAAPEETRTLLVSIEIPRFEVHLEVRPPPLEAINDRPDQ